MNDYLDGNDPAPFLQSASEVLPSPDIDPAPLVLPSGNVMDAGVSSPVEPVLPAPLIPPAPAILPSNAIKEKNKGRLTGSVFSHAFSKAEYTLSLKPKKPELIIKTRS